MTGKRFTAGSLFSVSTRSLKLCKKVTLKKPTFLLAVESNALREIELADIFWVSQT